MKKILIIFIFGINLNVYAQTPAQRQELEQIKADIAKANKHIADVTARTAVTDFFTQRFGYIHQTNAQCIAIVDKIGSLAEQLKTPLLMSQKYTSSQQAYAALEVMADLMLREDIILDQILKYQQELELQKSNLKSTELFLTYQKESVYRRFPKPDEIDDANTYYNALWQEYSADVQQHGPNMRYFISKCVNVKLDYSADIQKRKDKYREFNQQLTDYYLKAYAQEYADGILSKFKPSENTKLMLAIGSAFDELDTRYRKAIMIEFDYFKAIALIDSYENLATIILARAVPRESNPTVREEAQGEMKRRLEAAQRYKKIIQKEKPSYWLNKKYLTVQKNIKEGKSQCVATCRKHLDQVPSLISASRIVEDISTEDIYAMLGYQALDFVK